MHIRPYNPFIYNTVTQNILQVNEIKIECLGVWKFPSVAKCKKAERIIMSNVVKVMNKYDMPDGYTETCDFSELDYIVKIYEEFGGVKQ